MILWLYKNRNTGIQVWSTKYITEMGGYAKWAIIADYSTGRRILTIY